MPTRSRSRLNKNLEKKTKRNLFFSVVGIIVVLFLLIKFGVPALINFSLFLSQGKDQQAATEAANSQSILLPPTLDNPFSATNSATITVTGSAAANESIELFVNSQLIDTKSTEKDGSFAFEGVPLTAGGNTIKAKAKANNKETDFSNILSITYRNNPPALSVDSPFDGQTLSGGSQQNLIVKGKTDTDATVTVNGFWATADSSGNYSYTLHLQNGDNQIKVIATDNAGNSAEKDVKVTFNQ